MAKQSHSPQLTKGSFRNSEKHSHRRQVTEDDHSNIYRGKRTSSGMNDNIYTKPALSDYTRMRNKHKEQSRKTNNLSQLMKKNRSRGLKTPNSKASPSTVKTATHTPSSRNNRSGVGVDSHRESSRRRPKTSGLSAKQGGLLFSQRQKQDRNNSQHGSLQGRIGIRNDSRSRRHPMTDAVSGKNSTRNRRNYDQRKLLKVGALFNRDEFDSLEIQNVLNNWRILQCLYVSLQTENPRQVEPSLHTFFVNIFRKQYDIFLRGFTRYNKIRKKIFGFMVLEFWVFFLLFYIQYEKEKKKNSSIDSLFKQVLGHLTKNTFYVGLILLKAANFNVLALEVGYLQNFINRSQSFNFPTGVPLIKTLRSNNDAAFEKLNQILISCPRNLQKLFKRTFVGDYSDYSDFLGAVRAPLMMELKSTAQYIFKTMDESFFYGEYPFGMNSPVLESFRTPQRTSVFFSLCLDAQLNRYSVASINASKVTNSSHTKKDKRGKSKVSVKSKVSRTSRSKLSSKYAMANHSSRRSPRRPKGYKLTAGSRKGDRATTGKETTSRSRKERTKVGRIDSSQPKKMEHSVSKSLAKTFKMSVQIGSKNQSPKVKKSKNSKSGDNRLKKRLAKNEAQLDRLKNNYGAKRDRLNPGGMSKTGGETSMRNASKGSTRQMSRGIGSRIQISGYSKHSSLARSKKNESPIIQKLSKNNTRKKTKRSTRARDVETSQEMEDREENEMSANHLKLLEKKAKKMQLNQTPGRKRHEANSRSKQRREAASRKQISSKNMESPQPKRGPIAPQKKRGKNARGGSRSRNRSKGKGKTIVPSDSYAQNIGFGKQVNSPQLKNATSNSSRRKLLASKNKKPKKTDKTASKNEERSPKSANPIATPQKKTSTEQDLRTDETLDQPTDQTQTPKQPLKPKDPETSEKPRPSNKKPHPPKRTTAKANLTHTPNPKHMPYNPSLNPERKAKTPNPKPHLRREREPLISEELKDRKYCLVLDLDETLIHFKNDNGRAKFLIRPYTYNFLRNLREYYELIIFTAAQKEYADWILDKIDSKNLISYRFYRNHCIMSRVCHLKDISLLNRDLARTLIVDNFQENFSLQKDNGIHIKGWYGDTSDTVLETLETFLLNMAKSDTNDIRVYFKEAFGKQEFPGLTLFS